MAWTPSDQLRQQVELCAQEHATELLHGREADAERILRDHQERGLLRSGPHIQALMGAAHALAARYADQLSTDILDLLKRFARIDDESVAWAGEYVYAQLDRLKAGMAKWVKGRKDAYGITVPMDHIDGEVGRLIETAKNPVRMKLSKALGETKLSAAATPPQATSGSAATEPPLDALDQRIISELRQRIPAAAASYRQALKDLGTDRESWRGPGCDLREALRECLDVLAPDLEIEAQEGYQREPNTKGPTMRQKVRFVLKGRRGEETVETAFAVADEIFAKFVRAVYSRSNASTHGITDRWEVTKLHGLVRIALADLLDVGA